MDKKIANTIKSVLTENDQKTALKELCREFERLGYEVKIDGIKVTSETSDFTNFREPMNFSLYNSGSLKQEFSIKFPK